MQAIGYLSASHDQAIDLVEQNASFLHFCQTHGYQPTATFLDAEVSPSRPRPGLEQLLRHLRQESIGFTFVIVQSVRHLGLDATQSVRVALQLRSRGVQLISLEDGRIDDQTLVDLWRRDQQFQPDVERRRQLQHDRAERGQAIGRAPYGYAIDADGRYQIQDQEASVVRRIFDLYLRESLGIRRVAQRLNSDGLRTRRGGNWSMISIRDLLLNPVYIGRYERLGVVVEGNHHAIVSEPDFLAVAQLMAQRRTAPGVSHPSDFLLAGLVWCGEDQTRMIGVTRRQQWRRAAGEVASATYRYYQSEARTNQSVGSYHTRRADDLEREVLAHIRGERDGGERSVLNFTHDATALAAETAVAVATAESHLRAIDRKLSQLLDDAASVKQDSVNIQQDGGRLVVEWESATADLARIRSHAVAHEQEAERRRRRELRLRRVRDDWDRLNFAQQRDLVEQLVDRVIVYDHAVTTQLKA